MGRLRASVGGEEVWLLPERAAWAPAWQLLLLADLHVGKAGHFRRHGLAMPSGAQARDLERLGRLLDELQPKEVLLLGDLFHSAANAEWEDFRSFVRRFPEVAFVLLPGNHDRAFVAADWAGDLQLAPALWQRSPFVFTHEPLEAAPEAGYVNVCGHLHPGVRLAGRGRMKATLPCFWLGPQRLVLPAFGSLTGLGIVQPAAADQVAVIAGESCVWV
jgi:DNA ligase-associated metallophosphoesterase